MRTQLRFEFQSNLICFASVFCHMLIIFSVTFTESSITAPPSPLHHVHHLKHLQGSLPVSSPEEGEGGNGKKADKGDDHNRANGG